MATALPTCQALQPDRLKADHSTTAMDYEQFGDSTACVRMDRLRVPLYPFLHQVAGSSLMFSFDRNTICKPLLQEEFLFYCRLPESLKRFTPKCKGSIFVELEYTESGECNLFGLVTLAQLPTLNINLPLEPSMNENKMCKRKRSGSVQLDQSAMESYADPAMKSREVNRMSKKLGRFFHKNENKCILLENLVAKLEHPSVLDLKMGTKMYNYGDDEQRIGDKITKASMSTTGSLGVRLHGMQKYNANTRKYDTLTKRDGYQLTKEMLAVEVRNFLNDGVEYRSDLATQLIEKLKEYYECILRLDSYRLCASSLLIIYDGSCRCTDIDIRAVDFVHAEYPGYGNSEGPDLGYLCGIESLISILSQPHE